MAGTNRLRPVSSWSRRACMLATPIAGPCRCGAHGVRARLRSRLAPPDGVPFFEDAGGRNRTARASSRRSAVAGRGSAAALPARCRTWLRGCNPTLRSGLLASSWVQGTASRPSKVDAARALAERRAFCRAVPSLCHSMSLLSAKSSCLCRSDVRSVELRGTLRQTCAQERVSMVGPGPRPVRRGPALV